MIGTKTKLPTILKNYTNFYTTTLFECFDHNYWVIIHALDYSTIPIAWLTKTLPIKGIQMIIVGFKVASNEHKVLLIKMSYFTSEKNWGSNYKNNMKALKTNWDGVHCL
jgi:hypothetical protein